GQLGAALGALHFQLEEDVLAPVGGEDLREFLLIDLDGQVGFLMAIDLGRDEPLRAQTAAIGAATDLADFRFPRYLFHRLIAPAWGVRAPVQPSRVPSFFLILFFTAKGRRGEGSTFPEHHSSRSYFAYFASSW